MTKKYALIVEKDQVISVEVNGRKYKSWEEIPDDEDRGKMMLLAESFPGMEWSKPEKGQKDPLSRIFVPLFVSITVLMFGIALFSGARTASALSKEETAQGWVVDMVERANSEGTIYYYPVVEFSVPGQGRQTFQVYEGSWPPAYQKGQRVVVAYDLGDATKTRIRSAGSTLGMWTVTLITGILALSFLGATFFARWILKDEPVSTSSGKTLGET